MHYLLLFLTLTLPLLWWPFLKQSIDHILCKNAILIMPFQIFLEISLTERLLCYHNGTDVYGKYRLVFHNLFCVLTFPQISVTSVSLVITLCLIYRLILGEHFINIKFDGNHINGSPFKLTALPPNYLKRIKCKRIKTTVPVNYPMNFIIDASGTNTRPLDVQVLGPEANIYPCNVTSKKNGKLKCKYTPKETGEELVGH